MIVASEPGVLLTGRFDPKAKDLTRQLEAFEAEVARLQAKAGVEALVHAHEKVGHELVVYVLGAQSKADAPAKPKAKKK